MIQLASDPNASRTAWRPAQAEGKGAPLDARRTRSHAWPFISRHGEKPAAQEPQKNSNGDSGS
ncbi:hypothetical protein [Ramlibacter albus]|uniref:Uncharacterized protein n=1 Tax=Ramlibacter albus TaxID=2079448 RepID=A0A923S196_9BURK|nr:hypothetical protein [Ramlibacter albus]MBC5764060.1 hypothetical protein [Ramlibacter albus]